MDIDGNGMIDMEEFCLCMARHVAVSRQRAQQSQPLASHKPRLSTQQLRDAFNYFDKVLFSFIKLLTIFYKCAEFKQYFYEISKGLP